MGDKQIFSASTPVKWLGDAPNGVFTADGGGVQQIVGVAMDESGQIATATIKVGDRSLRVDPPLPVLHTGDQIELHAWTDAKNPTWSCTGCTAEGKFTAPNDIKEERVVIATVKTSEPELTASIPIRLMPTRHAIGAKEAMLFAMLFGALGGLVHAKNSLIAFVGNANFVGTWALFYLARPFVGAMMSSPPAPSLPGTPFGPSTRHNHVWKVGPS